MTRGDYIRTGPPLKWKGHRESSRKGGWPQVRQPVDAAVLHRRDAGEKALLASASPALPRVY